MASINDPFNPSSLPQSDTITVITRNPKDLPPPPPPLSASKPPKPTQSYPRLDLEPLYTELKALIGHNWETYFETTTKFIRGELNAREFADVCDEFVYASPKTEHAHNSLILAIICNVTKDAPEPGLAAWVSANSDKSALNASSKQAVTSDASEIRLKAEVMALPRRERRRLKAIVGDKPEEEAPPPRNPYEESYQASRIMTLESAAAVAPPTSAPVPALAPDDSAPGSATGSAPAPAPAPAPAASTTTKTNLDVEIKKGYQQLLITETYDLPDVPSLHSRMVPICYEESVVQGCSMQCAELVSIAAEMYLKGMLSDVFIRSRANGPRYRNTAGESILTKSYKRNVERETADFEAGEIQKGREDGLLPTQAEVAHSRRPIGMPELQLASQVAPRPWNGSPLIAFEITAAAAGHDYQQWLLAHPPPPPPPKSMGLRKWLSDPEPEPEPVDPMDVDKDEDDYGWEGTSPQDRMGLQSLLTSYLAASA